MANRFTHDCEECTYLGEYEGYDLYWCPVSPTVIARFGNAGESYISGLPFVRTNEALREALIRAAESGLLSNYVN